MCKCVCYLLIKIYFIVIEPSTEQSGRKSSGCCKYKNRVGLSREEIARLEYQRKTRALDRAKKAFWGKVASLEESGLKCFVIIEDPQRRRIQVGGSSDYVERALGAEPVLNVPPEVTVSRVEQSSSTRGRKRGIVFPSPQKDVHSSASFLPLAVQQSQELAQRVVLQDITPEKQLPAKRPKKKSSRALQYV